MTRMVDTRPKLVSALLWALGSLSVCATCRASSPPAFLFVDEQGAERAVLDADLAKLPRVMAQVVGHDGQRAEYEGVRLSDLLQSLGVVLGKELRGPRVASYVLLEAKDDYRVVVAIAETDPATTDRLVLLADRKDGEPLPENEGPWRLIIPDEKRPVRWLRTLTRMSVGAPRPRALQGTGQP